MDVLCYILVFVALHRFIPHILQLHHSYLLYSPDIFWNLCAVLLSIDIVLFLGHLQLNMSL
jgi:hypothetical protein